MASTETPAPQKIEAPVPEKIEPPEAPEQEKPTPAPEEPPPETKAVATDSTPIKYFPLIDVILRVLLFASAVVAVVVTVTSKQTELVPLPFPPFRPLLTTAKFNHSPAFIYFVAALSVAGLYSIISTALSVYALLKPDWSARLVSHLVIFDVLLLGIVASATGAAGGVAYIGLKGNSHVRWQKVCNTYDVFCKHIASSIAISLFGSVVLVLLVLLSVYSLSKKIPK